MSHSRRVLGSLAALGLTAVAVSLAHPRQLTWGTTVEERSAPLPGDDLLARADLVATRAIDIDAPPAAVWPWLAQLGQGRAGFYSYDALENLLGLDIHSAGEVVPAWQDVRVGDEVHLAPEFALTVAIAEAPKALVLHGGAPVDDDDAPPFTFTWAFAVADRGLGSRLLVRERYAYALGWAGRMVAPVSWLSFLMTERMLRGIRDRAERLHTEG